MHIPFLFALVSMVLCSPLAAWQTTPSTAAPGETISLTGTPPFAADAVVVFFDTTSDAGTLLDDVQSTPSGLEGQIGSAAGPLTGQAEIWWGSTAELPAETHQSDGYTYIPRSPSGFTGWHNAQGGSDFSLDDGTDGTGIGLPDGSGGLGIGLPGMPPPMLLKPLALRVDIVIDGGEVTQPEPPPSDDLRFGRDRRPTKSAAESVLWVGRMVVDILPNGPVPGFDSVPAQLENDLAALLQKNFGPLGLIVTQDAGCTSFSLANAEIRRGFILVQILP